MTVGRSCGLIEWIHKHDGLTKNDGSPDTVLAQKNELAMVNFAFHYTKFCPLYYHTEYTYKYDLLTWNFPIFGYLTIAMTDCSYAEREKTIYGCKDKLEW